MENNIKAMQVYVAMLDRCYNERNHAYKNYGQRGVKVCDEWINNPTSFLNWHKERFFPKGQVDRIDVNGNYEPSNCRIVTAKENSNNKRNTIYITAFGETKSLSHWSEDVRIGRGVNRSTIVYRIKGGFSPEECISLDVSAIPGQAPVVPTYTAFGETKTLHEWSIDKRCVIIKKVLWDRFQRGWNIEEAITKPPAANMGICYEGRSILQISEDADCEVSYNTLARRLKSGISVEEAKKNNLPEAFGEKKTLNAWSKDPRCKVNLTSLKKRLDKGMSLEAAITSANAFKGSK